MGILGSRNVISLANEPPHPSDSTQGTSGWAPSRSRRRCSYGGNSTSTNVILIRERVSRGIEAVRHEHRPNIARVQTLSTLRLKKGVVLDTLMGTGERNDRFYLNNGDAPASVRSNRISTLSPLRKGYSTLSSWLISEDRSNLGLMQRDF